VAFFRTGEGLGPDRAEPAEPVLPDPAGPLA